MNPKSRRCWLLLAVLLVGMAAWGRRRLPEPTLLTVVPDGARNDSVLPDRRPSMPVAGAAVRATNAPAAAVAGAVSGRQRAFRFVLSGDELQLEVSTELKGDFRPARRGAIWAPGRICCRLLDAEQRVLAEDTVPAPDFTCTVLDGSAGSPGESVPVRFTTDGPVTFQVRLPDVPAARELRVYRLTGFQPPMADAEPAGRLLASLALQP